MEDEVMGRSVMDAQYEREDSVALLRVGNALLIKNEEGQPDVRLNGQPLWPEWVALDQGDRLQVGSCCLEVASTQLEKLDSEAHAESSPSVLGEDELPTRFWWRLRYVPYCIGLAAAYVAWVALLDQI